MSINMGFRPTLAHAQKILSLLRGLFGEAGLCFGYDFVGSAGRQISETFGDVDILISASERDIHRGKIILGEIFGYHKNGTPKNRGMIGDIPVDIFFCTPETYGAVYVFYSLPWQLQLAMRAIARARGFRLGPKGLKNMATGEVADTRFISEVYNILGVRDFTGDEYKNVSTYAMEIR